MQKLNEWKVMNTGSAINSATNDFQKVIDQLMADYKHVSVKTKTNNGIYVNYFNNQTEYSLVVVQLQKGDHAGKLDVVWMEADGPKLLDHVLADDLKDLGDFLIDRSIIKSRNLLEWKVMNVTNTSATAAQPAASGSKNYPDQTYRYERLLAQIDSDKTCTYTINLLNDRILDITVDTKNKKDISVKIIFKPYVPDYLLQVNGKDLSCKDFEEVLEVLIAAGIINNTDFCESASFAREFKLYENLWN